jgi:hypothetical protein
LLAGPNVSNLCLMKTMSSQEGSVSTTPSRLAVASSARSRPHRRCWAARPDLGERCPFRLVATAAENRLSFRHNARDLGRVLINAQIAAGLCTYFALTSPLVLSNLPVLQRNGGPIYAWPPLQPSLVEQMGGIPVPMGGVFGSDWHEKLDQRDTELRTQLNHAAEEAEARQRERKAREKAEIEAARERDRQAYREGGWPT